MTARAVSDYKEPPAGEIRLWPDGLPFVGAITFAERKRRHLGLPLRAYLDGTVEDLSSGDLYKIFGLDGWPKAADEDAARRARMHGSRHLGFLIYQTASYLATVAAVSYGIYELTERLF